MMKIEILLNQLTDYAVKNELITEADRIFIRNRLLEVLEIDDWCEPEGSVPGWNSLEEILDGILDYASETGLISGTNESKDLFDTKIMSVFVPLPSAVIKDFEEDYIKVLGLFQSKILRYPEQQ